MNVVVLHGYGINCEEETLYACMEAGKYLQTSVSGKVLHINELLASPAQLKDYNTMIIPGGFSYGDDTGAGNAFALRLKHGLNEALQEFAARDTLTLGICNGCQILLRLLFPGVALLPNDIGRYQCRWVRVKTCCTSSAWLNGVEEMYLPVAHGEGKFYVNDESVLHDIERGDNVALRYVKDDGTDAHGEFPYNPNGSVRDIAALTQNGGRTLLMMPHPERAIMFTQRYDWTDVADARRRENMPIEKYADGFKIFCNAVRYFA